MLNAAKMIVTITSGKV